MRAILLIFLSTIYLLAADLNLTLVNENNLSLFEVLKMRLDPKNPDYKLQTTLIDKIETILKSKPKLIDPKELNVTKSDKFIDTFVKINRLLAQAKEAMDEIEALDEQLSDLKENISQETNETKSLSLQLEYAYYAKLKAKKSQFAQTVLQNYSKWLDILLSRLEDIRFQEPSSQKLDLALKNIAYFEKLIKKYSIEKERSKILQREDLYERLKKKIEILQKKKEQYVLKALKIKLVSFFQDLKRKNPDTVLESKAIVAFVRQHSATPHLDDALQLTLNYTINKVLGNFMAKLTTFKEQVLTFLQSNSFLGVPLYRLSEALGIFLLFLLFRKIFTLMILKSLQTFAKMSKNRLDDTILEIFGAPLSFAFIILGFYFALDITGISGATFQNILKSLVLFDIFWLLYNSIKVLDETIYNFAKKIGKELYREIGAFFIKLLKIFVFSIGFVSILQVWNIDVSAFLASLGLGGLAFALAAKDTAANLFGGLSILADRALKIDDWIKVGDVEGTVENIGLRTTKIRTFEKSLVTVPNQMIANNPIENFSRRNVRRIKANIGLIYGTTQEQIENIVQDIRNMLKSHPGIAKDQTLLVNFDRYEDSSLNIFIYCFTNTAEWAKYLDILEDINLKIKEIVAKNGSDFAFPSESIYIEKLPK